MAADPADPRSIAAHLAAALIAGKPLEKTKGGPAAAARQKSILTYSMPSRRSRISVTLRQRFSRDASEGAKAVTVKS